MKLRWWRQRDGSESQVRTQATHDQAARQLDDAHCQSRRVDELAREAHQAARRVDYFARDVEKAFMPYHGRQRRRSV